MEKKKYITPKTIAVDVQLQQMIAFSGGGQNGTDIIITNDEDNIDIPIRSRGGFGFDNDDDVITPYGGNTYIPF